MAKKSNKDKDPALQRETEFDDDIFSDLDFEDSDLDGFDIDLTGQDSKKNRKPVEKDITLTSALNHAGKAAAGGAALGIASKLRSAMPDVGKAFDGAVNVASDFSRLKDDVVADIKPVLTQTKVAARQLWPYAKDLVPDSIYNKVLKKLEASEERRPETPSKEEARSQAMNDQLTAIFDAQEAQRQEERKEAAIQKTIDDRLTQSRHYELASLTSDIRNQAMFHTKFLRGTYTAYLRKDLELKYRRLYLAEDTLEALRITSQMLEKKLDSIRHNTALPDYQKITITEIAKQKIGEEFMSGFSGHIRNYVGGIRERLKEQIIDPLKDMIGGTGDAASMLAESLAMQAEMGEMTGERFDTRKSLLGMLGSGVGKAIGAVGGRRLLAKIPPDVARTISNYASVGGPGLLLLLDQIREGNLEFKGSTTLQKLLETFTPELDKTAGKLKNTDYENLDKAGTITKRFITTVEQIIPGYLATQTKYLAQIAGDWAHSKEEMYWDFRSSQFKTGQQIKDRIVEEAFGTREQRANILKGNEKMLGDIIDRRVKSKSLTEKPATYDQVAKDLAILVNNCANSKRVSTLDVESLKEVAETGSSNTDFAQIAFRGLKSPQEAAKVLLAIITETNGTINQAAKSDIEKHIVSLAVQNSDRHRTAIYNALIKEGRFNVLQGVVDTDEKGDYVVNQQFYDQLYDDVTEQEIASTDVSSQYDYFGNEVKAKTALEKGVDQFTWTNIKKLGGKAVSSVDKVLGAGAELVGFGDEYAELRKLLASNWQEACAWMQRKKLQFLKLPLQAKHFLARNIWEWMGESRDSDIRALRSVLFTDRGYLRKTTDHKQLAAVLIRIPGLHSVLQRIRTSNNPILWMLNQMLPDVLVALADMSEDEAEQLIAGAANADRVADVLRRRAEQIKNRKADREATKEARAQAKKNETEYQSPSQRGQYKYARRSWHPSGTTPQGSTGPVSATVTQKVEDTLKGQQPTKFALGGTVDDRGRNIGATFNQTLGGEAIGTVTKPTLLMSGQALVGERGPETIVPLNHSPEAQEAYLQAKAYHEGQVYAKGATINKRGAKEPSLWEVAKQSYAEARNRGAAQRKKKLAQEIKEPGFLERLSQSLANSKDELLQRFTDEKARRSANQGNTTAKTKKTTTDTKTTRETTGKNAKNQVLGFWQSFKGGLDDVYHGSRFYKWKEARKTKQDATTSTADVTTATTDLGYAAYAGEVPKTSVGILGKQLQVQLKTLEVLTSGIKISNAGLLAGVNPQDWAKRAWEWTKGTTTSIVGGITGTIKNIVWDVPKTVLTNALGFGLPLIGSLVSGIASGGKKLLGTISKHLGPTAGALLKTAGNVLSAPFGVAKSLFTPYVDVYYRDDKRNPKQPLVTATELKTGLVVDHKGETPKDSYHINGPLWFTKDPANGDKAGQVAITVEQFDSGLVDVNGKPLNRLATLVGSGIRGVAGLAKRATGAVFGGASGAIGFLTSVAVDGARAVLRKKDPYINVYVRNKKGEIDPKRPRLTGTGIREGRYRFEDGTVVKSAYDITQPVYNAEGTETLISADNIEAGLYDAKGNKLTKFAGKSLLGKAAALAVGTTTKVVGGLARGAIRVATGLYKGAKGFVTGLVKTGNQALDALSGFYFKTIETVVGARSVKRKDLEELVGDRLLDIYGLLYERLPKPKSVLGDADNDGDRDGSYRDYVQKQKERAARRKEQEEAEARKKAGANDNKGGLWSSLLAKFRSKKNDQQNSEDDGFSLTDAWAAKELWDGFKKTKVGRGVSKITSAAGRGLKGLKNLAAAGAGKVLDAGKSILSKAGTALKNTKIGTKAVQLAGRGAGTIARGAGWAGRIAMMGAGKATAAIVAAAANPVTWAALLAAAGISMTWWLLSDSDEEKSLKKLRYEAYGIDPKNDDQVDAIEDLEELCLDILNDKRGEITRDELEEAAEDMGFIDTGGFFSGPGMKQDELKRRLSYFAGWYAQRFRPIFDLYIERMKGATQMERTDDDMPDPDDIPEENFPYVVQYLDKWFKQITNNPDVKRYVPTEDGYKKAIAAEAKASGKPTPEEKAQQKQAKAAERANKPSLELQAEKRDLQQQIRNKTQQQATDRKNAADLNRRHQDQVTRLKSRLAEVGKAGTAAAITSAATRQNDTGDGTARATDYSAGSATNANAGSTPGYAGMGPVTPGANGTLNQGLPAIDVSRLSAIDIPDGGSSDLGTYVKQFESGPQGSAAIGYDSTGGTSYGMYQIASKNGSFAKFTQYASKEGGEFGRQLVNIMKAAGNPNTGSRRGPGPTAWKKLAEINGGESIHKLESGFIYQTHYLPALRQITDPEARALIESDRGLKEALWSTAIQHGPGNATRGAGGIFNKTYKKGITPAEWLAAIYAKRGTQFGSSSANVRRSVQNRFRKELPIVLGLSKTSATSSVSSVADTSTADAASTNFASTTGSDATSGGTSISSGAGGGDGTAVAGPTNIPYSGNIDTSAITFQNSSVDFKNLSPILQERFANMAKAYQAKFGKKIQINSGKRSMEKQAQLYRQNPRKAAKPSPLSPHISGLALDAQSVDMNRADSAGLLAQFGLWRPLKNGLGRTKPEAWHVEVAGSRDPKTKRITEETLRAINSQVDLNAGEEPVPGSPATTDTSADGTAAQSMEDQAKNTEKEQPVRQAAAATPNTQSTSAAVSSSGTSSVSTAVQSSVSNQLADTSTSPTNTNAGATPSTADTGVTTPAAPTAESANATANAAMAQSVANQITTTAGPTVSTNTPNQTGSVGPEITADAQVQELKLVNQILANIRTDLQGYFGGKQPTTSTPQGNTTAPAVAGDTTTTQAITQAIIAAFGPGSPILDALVEIANHANPALKNDPHQDYVNSRNNVPQKVSVPINTTKSTQFRTSYV